ncbi:MAG TPA: hypothetical protein VMU84_10435 [Thermoanaerobaculia bacterium]|nr:hypothetical protein [Thermoanaerobaculia bacterium]
MVILHGFFHVDRFRRDVQHHRRLDLLGMRAAFFLADRLLDRLRHFEIRVTQRDAFALENLRRGRERTQRGDAGVEHVELLRTEARERAADVDDHVARGLEAKRRRAGIFDERRIEPVVQRRRDHDVARIAHAPLQILRDQEIIFEFEMRTMFLRRSAERNDDDRVRRELFLCFEPREVFEEDAFRSEDQDQQGVHGRMIFPCQRKKVGVTRSSDGSSFRTTRSRLTRC